MKHKNIIALAIASLIFSPTVTFAARRVPGTVPNNPPLQPIPIGSAPNASHNIQGSSEDSTGQLNTNNTASSNTSAALENSASKTAVQTSNPMTAASSSFGGIWVWLFSIAGAGLVAFIYWRGRKAQLATKTNSSSKS